MFGSIQVAISGTVVAARHGLMPEGSLEELSRLFGIPAQRVDEVIEHTCAGLPQDRYYVFRIGGDARSAPASPERPRTIAAFPTPDDALAFAQRNGYAKSAQIRPVQAHELVKLLLRDATIGTVLFLHPTTGAESRRGFPPGVRLTRQSLVDQLREAPSPPLLPADLSAKAYDELQFGVDFVRRGAFRAALTQAVEAVVDSYRPPPGSLDEGPRSIYGTSAVEAWLREHGFPRAAQRRWITLAGQMGWDGAEELCEIDCGTRQRLVVQLLIYLEGERQYIGRVVVTS